jgi:hypothetical protein
MSLSETPTFKTCPDCKTKKPSSAFNKNGNKLQDYCKDCHSKRQKASREKNSNRKNIVIPDFKTCSNCGVEKPSSCFCRSRGNRSGLGSFCKDCQSKHQKRSYGKNKARKYILIPDFKTCPGCNIEKPGCVFGQSRGSKDGLGVYCKVCSAIHNRKRRYGVTEEWYQAILLAQNYSCAICKTKTPGGKGTWHTDHNHLTGEVRGLLCNNCNSAIGCFKDSTFLIDKAIKYLSFPMSGIVYKKASAKNISAAFLKAQNGLCKVCLTDLSIKGSCLDHCHLTGIVRGCLCRFCNLGLGRFGDFGDSASVMQSAIEYLIKFESLKVAPKV